MTIGSRRAVIGKNKKKKERVTFEKPAFDNPFGALAGLDLPEGEPESNREPVVSTAVALQKIKIRLRKERKNRRGKTVTILALSRENESLSTESLEDLKDTLKKKLGVGAFLEEEQIVLQGEVLDRVKKVLIDLGYEDVK